MNIRSKCSCFRSLGVSKSTRTLKGKKDMSEKTSTWYSLFFRHFHRRRPREGACPHAPQRLGTAAIPDWQQHLAKAKNQAVQCTRLCKIKGNRSKSALTGSFHENTTKSQSLSPAGRNYCSPDANRCRSGHARRRLHQVAHFHNPRRSGHAGPGFGGVVWRGNPGFESGGQAERRKVSREFHVPAFGGRSGRFAFPGDVSGPGISKITICDLEGGTGKQCQIPALRFHRTGRGDAVGGPSQRNRGRSECPQ